MHTMQNQMLQMQQKIALQDQNFRSYVKNQNTQRTTNDARDRLFNERRFGPESQSNNNNNTSWQDKTT